MSSFFPLSPVYSFNRVSTSSLVHTRADDNWTDRQIHFFALPSLDPVTNIKPIRNVLTFAVDHRHLQRPPIIINESVEFSVIKRSGISMFSLRNDKLFYQKVIILRNSQRSRPTSSQEIPLPSDSPPALACKRVGHVLCYADNVFYSMVDLDQASLFQLLPLRQSVEDTPFEIKPIIEIIGENELLILSWTGASALGVFITGDGDPVRGTLEWTGYPKAVCKPIHSFSLWGNVFISCIQGLDYPYITSLLPDETIEVHSIETQSMMQVIQAPTQSDAAPLSLTTSLHGYLVPSTEKSRKMEKVKIRLFRSSMKTWHSDEYQTEKFQNIDSQIPKCEW